MQISSISFYNFLMNIGLMPNKSKVVGKINVPTDFYNHFLKGVIDGDGCIGRWKHPRNNCEQWSLRIVSASENFINWLKCKIELIMGAKGRIYREEAEGKERWILKYGKIASRRIFNECYECEPELELERKACLAKKCCRSVCRWSKSKTLVH